uniref:Tsukushin n=1 Tax=Xenopus laevis TaxID=8355 RepID=B7ZS03_XENLA|nr:Unknown (protein for MGC:197077) [Xenopus laevis]
MALSSWIFFLLVHGIVGGSRTCFPGCRCIVDNFGLFHSFSLTKVDCSDVGPHVVPVSIPLDTSYLDLSSNRLKTINESVLSGPGYTTLINLNLSYNQIVKISYSTFSKLRYLESLDLSHNLLETLPDGSFLYSRLTELDLSSNKLQKVGVGAFTLKSQGRSMTINLANNEIHSISRGAERPVPNIHSLMLSGNRLLSVPDLHGIPLHQLDLDRNPLSKIEKESFLGLEGLTHLSLSDLPNLREVSPYSFKSLTSLLELDLSNNPNLKSLSSDMFFGLNALQELDLAYSGVAYLPKDIMLHLPSMKSITWGENIRCLKTVKESIFHAQKGKVQKEVLLCHDDHGAVPAQDLL